MYTDTPRTGAACSAESRRACRRGVVAFAIPVVFRTLLALEHVIGYVLLHLIIYPWRLQRGACAPASRHAA